MTSAPTVSVLDIDPDTLPPIPDREPITQWVQRYQEVRDFAGPPPAGIDAGNYQSVLLDTRTGALSFHCADWQNKPIPMDCTREEWEAHHPGTLFCHGTTHDWCKPAPDLLSWVIDGGTPHRPYLTAAQARDFLHVLTPLAQHLLKHLLPVPGTNDRDYTPEAASAARDITRACSWRVEQPLGLRPNLVLMDQVVAVMPELVKPAWATADDVTLDEEAEIFTKYFAIHHPQLHRLLDVPQPASPLDHLEILGARAWMYGQRGRQRCPA